MKFRHEFRDPIHAFVRMDRYERMVVDSAPFQRLRHIHQLALTHLVYPGATHRRFEHCLGVMELAGRVFDIVTRPDKLKEAAGLVPQLEDARTVEYWRNVVRMAALCHDLGHLPFSHAGEGLLPEGETHETVTKRFIESEEIRRILEEETDAPIRADDVAALAVECKSGSLPPWKQVLADIIQSDYFGVDRIDYLLRDSHHAGVAYGRFDHFRLLDTIRILPPPPETDVPEDLDPEAAKQLTDPQLGVEKGGLQSAEGLLLARYFMFSQVYLHPIRRIYDIHLHEFLRASLEGGTFSSDPESLLGLTDNETLVRMHETLRGDKDHPAFDPADRIINRKHFKPFYEPSGSDLDVNLEAGKVIFEAAQAEFGEGYVRHDHYKPRGGVADFRVLVGEQAERPPVRRPSVRSRSRSSTAFTSNPARSRKPSNGSRTTSRPS